MSDREELAAYRRMAELEDKANGGVASPKEKSGFLANAIGSVAEPLANMATGMIAKPFSDIAGLAATGVDAVTGSNGAADFKKYVQDQLTYNPRTDAGKAVTESAYNPVNIIGKAIEGVSTGAGDFVRKGNSPIFDAAGNFVQEAIPQAIAIGGTKLAQRYAPDIKALEDSSRQNIALKNAQAAPLTETLQNGLDAGLVVPPSSVKPSFWNTTKEGIAGKSATAQEASNRNAPVFDSLARKSIRVADDVPLTAETTKLVRQQAYDAGYKPLEQLGRIPTDSTYRAALDSLVDKFQGASRSFPEAVKPEAMDVVNSLKVGSFDTADALKMSQILRDEANVGFKAGENGIAQVKKGAAKVIEDRIERRLEALGGNGQTMLSDFRDARQLMAKAHTVEDAIVTGGKSIDPREFAKRAQAGKYLSDEQQVIGNFANNFPKASQPANQISGPGVSKVNSVAAGFGGTAGFGVGGPVGAAIGAVAPFVIPPVMRSYLLSRGSQNALAELMKVGRPERAARNALKSILPATAIAEANATRQ